MKHILLFGAGKSATVLIDYLKMTAIEKKWKVTVADNNFQAIQSKVGNHDLVHSVQVNILHDEERKALVQQADVVISLMPPTLHYLIAMDCILYKKHLLTASYVDEKIKNEELQIKENGLLFLYEMGLDPGIDHMSALQIIHQIKNKGGTITSFKSHCGGLVAPECDDNPWHYKISWNPRNVVLAGKAGAVFKEKSVSGKLGYEELFHNCNEVEIDGLGKLAYYPNRDSLSYMDVYDLKEAATFMRTTLRHPDFCKGWKYIVDMGLSNENEIIETDELTVADFFAHYVEQHQLHSLLKETLSNPLTNKQFGFLFLGNQTIINKGRCSIADVLQFILEQKLMLRYHDKDMIVMLHEIAYEINNQQSTIKSLLIVKGDNNVRTAMAKTVGLPLGIAVKLLLEGKVKEKGLHIPIIAPIYEPVLKELQANGISFHES